MAHHTTEADMPMLELPGGTVFTFEALSPTTGAAITSVNVSNISIYGLPVTGGELVERIVPALSPEEVEGL